MNANPYTTGDTILKLTDVSLNFGNKKILRDINMEIKDLIRPGVCQGQIESIIAPSGTGKTQLLKIIANLQKPSTGTVLIDSPQRPVKVGDIGVVQQNYPLLKHRDVMGNLKRAVDKSLEKMTDAEKKDKIAFYLNAFGMWDKRNEHPDNLSGGQKQRIAIAQALLCSEHFLLLDEPFSGLDIVSIDIVSEMIVNIANSHELNTIIIVSHDITSTAAISDTIRLLGKEKDANGKFIDGAIIKHSYDLVEEDLAWHPNLRNDPRFATFCAQIANDFKNVC